MKYLLLILTVCFSLTITSCSTVSSGDSLSFKAIEWLSDSGHQNMVKDSLIVSGSLLLKNATSDDDRKIISDYMWASSVAFKSLATGDNVTPDTLRNVLGSFLSPSKSDGVVQYTSALNLAWQFVYTNLKYIKDPSLIKTWLLLFADAGESVASSYK